MRRNYDIVDHISSVNCQCGAAISIISRVYIIHDREEKINDNDKRPRLERWTMCATFMAESVSVM